MRQGNSKVATVVMLNGRLGSGFCSPALTWAQTAMEDRVRISAAFANFTGITPWFLRVAMMRSMRDCRPILAL